jgi:hypothetical protein
MRVWFEGCACCHQEKLQHQQSYLHYLKDGGQGMALAEAAG